MRQQCDIKMWNSVASRLQHQRVECNNRNRSTPPTYSHQKHLQASSPNNNMISLWGLINFCIDFDIQLFECNSWKLSEIIWGVAIFSFKDWNRKEKCCFILVAGCFRRFFALVSNLFPQVIKSCQVKHTQVPRLEMPHSQ